MNNTNKTLAGILTTEDVAAIMAAVPFDEIELDGLGYETYEDNEHHLSLALKHESGIEDTKPGYIVNLFCNRDEYINIPGFYSQTELKRNSRLHETIAKEWNQLVMCETNNLKDYGNNGGGTFEPLTFAETAERAKATEQVLQASDIAEDE